MSKSHHDISFSTLFNQKILNWQILIYTVSFKFSAHRRSDKNKEMLSYCILITKL